MTGRTAVWRDRLHSSVALDLCSELVMLTSKCGISNAIASHRIDHFSKVAFDKQSRLAIFLIITASV